MAWGQGANDITSVAVTTSGVAVTFSNKPTTIYVRNASSSDVYLSLSSTAGSTDGHPIQTTGERYITSRDGYWAGLSLITTLAGSSAAVQIFAWR